MSYRRLRLLAVPVIALVSPVLAATSVAGQSTSSDVRRHAGIPSTAWGDPDLQGVWTSSGATPMERPDEYQGRETLSDAEVARIRRETCCTRRTTLARRGPENRGWGQRGHVQQFLDGQGSAVESDVNAGGSTRRPVSTVDACRRNRQEQPTPWSRLVGRPAHLGTVRHARRDAQCHVSSVLQQ